MTNSGFTITNGITQDASGVYHLTVSKTGAAVTANGFSSTAGTCAPNVSTVVQP
jgi:hypothetical protein